MGSRRPRDSGVAVSGQKCLAKFGQTSGRGRTCPPPRKPPVCSPGRSESNVASAATTSTLRSTRVRLVSKPRSRIRTNTSALESSGAMSTPRWRSWRMIGPSIPTCANPQVSKSVPSRPVCAAERDFLLNAAATSPNRFSTRGRQSLRSCSVCSARSQIWCHAAPPKRLLISCTI
jgi:hypothetical protein